MSNLNSKLLHSELTHEIIGAGMDVHNALGPGWDEMTTEKPAVTEGFLEACKHLLKKHGLGYGETTSAKLLMAECGYSECRVEAPSVPLKYEGQILAERAIDGFILDSEFAVKVSALQERTTAADMARLMSYMRHLNIKFGALVNFGRETLCVRGVIQNQTSHLH